MCVCSCVSSLFAEQTVMIKTLVIATALILVPNLSFASDDMLAAAMKKIEELEAKNKAQAAEINSLKRYKPHQFVSNNKYIAPQRTINEESKVLSQGSSSVSPLAGFFGGLNGGYGGGDVTNVQDQYSLPILGYTSLPNIYVNNVTTSRYGGALVGIQLGYNYISHNNLLFGALVDFDWADISNNQNSYGGFYTNNGNTYSTRGERIALQWLGTARTRLGYNYRSMVAFISGGLAFGNASNYYQFDNRIASDTFWGGGISKTSTAKTSLGWTAGAGIEYSLSNNVSISTEYLYTSISPSSQKGFLIIGTNQPAVTISSLNSYASPLGFHQIRVGLNYHFNAGEEKVVAKY